MIFPFQYPSPLHVVLLHIIFQNTNSLEKVLTNILIRFSVNVLILRLCYQSVTLQKWISLATDQHITSRTCHHYHVRWHFFWQAGVQDGAVKVIYVETTNQEADYLTKGLPIDGFTRIREKVQGW